MIIKLVSAFAALDQKILLSVMDLDPVKKSVVAIGKKLYIDTMDEFCLRFANAAGEEVDYTKPALDYAKAWRTQGCKTGTVVYVLKKSQELPEEEQEKIRAEAAAKAPPAAAASSSSSSTPAPPADAPEGAKTSGTPPPPPPPAPASKGSPTPPPPPTPPTAADQQQPPTPPRSATPVSAAQQYAAAGRPAGAGVAQPQAQHPSGMIASPNPLHAPPPTPASGVQLFAGGASPPSPPMLPPPPPPQYSPEFYASGSPTAGAADEPKTAESMIYQLREQNRVLRDEVFQLEVRNRELEAKAINAAYSGSGSGEYSPAHIAQMQLQLRDAAGEIERLRANESYLREQLAAAPAQQSHMQSVLDKLDPVTRAVLEEDKSMLGGLVEARRKTLASTLSLYQLAHGDVESAKIRSQHEHDRRQGVIATSAFASTRGGGGGGGGGGGAAMAPPAITAAASSSSSKHAQIADRRR